MERDFKSMWRPTSCPYSPQRITTPMPNDFPIKDSSVVTSTPQESSHSAEGSHGRNETTDVRTATPPDSLPWEALKLTKPVQRQPFSYERLEKLKYSGSAVRKIMETLHTTGWHNGAWTDVDDILQALVKQETAELVAERDRLTGKLERYVLVRPHGGEMTTDVRTTTPPDSLPWSETWSETPEELMVQSESADCTIAEVWSPCNLQYIVTACNAYPELVAERDRLKARVELLEGLLRRAQASKDQSEAQALYTETDTALGEKK